MDEQRFIDDPNVVDRLVASIATVIRAITGKSGAAFSETDGALLARKREMASLRAKAAAIQAAGDKDDHPEIWDRVWQVEEEIAITAPASLAGAAVKLRLFADPHIGIEGVTDDDPGSVRTRKGLFASARTPSRSRRR